MVWHLTYRADPVAAALADRHYTRQSPGSVQFVPPARCVVLRTREGRAVWATTWPLAAYVQHAWAGAWINSLFRNEAPESYRSSDLIREAVSATRALWPAVPDLGLVSFVDPSKVRHKRDPGRCYRKAGFRLVGETQGGLLAWQLLAEAMPDPALPLGGQMTLMETRHA